MEPFIPNMNYAVGQSVLEINNSLVTKQVCSEVHVYKNILRASCGNRGLQTSAIN